MSSENQGQEMNHQSNKGKSRFKEDQPESEEEEQPSSEEEEYKPQVLSREEALKI
jgi:hypothetical protein